MLFWIIILAVAGLGYWELDAYLTKLARVTFEEGLQAYYEGIPMDARWPMEAQKGYMQGWNDDNRSKHIR